MKLKMFIAPGLVIMLAPETAVVDDANNHYDNPVGECPISAGNPDIPIVE